MSELAWVLNSPTSLLAQQMRRDIRARRRLFPNGTRFIYQDLSELWSSDHHVVLNHTGDPVWQHWAHHPEHGWTPVGLYPGKADAMAAAQNHVWDIKEESEAEPEPGVYVVAGWPREGEEIVYTVRTRCSSKNNAIALADTLRSIGMVTSHEEISARA